MSSREFQKEHFVQYSFTTLSPNETYLDGTGFLLQNSYLNLEP
jgi:hypothetical protein